MDPKQLVLDTKGSAPHRSMRPPRHKLGEKFLKGPIPWDWLARAARQPGKALHVAIGIWHLAGMTNKRTVTLSGSILGPLGVDRHAGYRGLKALEDAGLVAVKRSAGRHPVVTILAAEKSKGALCGDPGNESTS